MANNYYHNYGKKSVQKNNNAAPKASSNQNGKKQYSAGSGNEGKEVHAPYNFAPFASTVFRRYKSMADLPSHDYRDPGLLTGEIQVTLKAETPVLVSDGKGEEKQFFRNAEGKYTIPGASIRGLLRTNMQILGFGLIRPGEDLADRRIFYRKVATARGATAKKLQKTYNELIGYRNGMQTKLKCGYLHFDGKKYYITMAGHDGKGFRIKRQINKDPNVTGPKADKKPNPLAAQWRGKWTFREPVWYKAARDKVTAVSAVEKPGYQSGIAVCTGYMSRQNSVYVFPEDSGTRVMEFDKNDDYIIDFKEDYETRKNTLRGTKGNMKPSFWELPGKGKFVPVFYLESARIFGMTQFLRVPYEKPLSAGLPDAHLAAIRSGELFLDYPYAVMGFATKQAAYKSRVRVEDFRVKDDPDPYKPVPCILGEPKVSFFPGYAKNTGQKALYYNSDFELRGVKQYWLKKGGSDIDAADKENVKSVLRPLPEGTCFTGTIAYENLHPDELGLLLWCITLDEGCYQTIGMGKPYGFGRMSVNVDRIWELEPESMYSSLTAARQWNEHPAERVAELIAAYETKAAELRANAKNTSIRQYPGIQDFLYMKKPADPAVVNTVYMSLGEYQNVEEALKTVRELKKAPKKMEVQAEQDPRKAKLQEWLNSNKG